MSKYIIVRQVHTGVPGSSEMFDGSGNGDATLKLIDKTVVESFPCEIASAVGFPESPSLGLAL